MTRNKATDDCRAIPRDRMSTKDFQSFENSEVFCFAFGLREAQELTCPACAGQDKVLSHWG